MQNTLLICSTPISPTIVSHHTPYTYPIPHQKFPTRDVIPPPKIVPNGPSYTSDDFSDFFANTIEVIVGNIALQDLACLSVL